MVVLTWELYALEYEIHDIRNELKRLQEEADQIKQAFQTRQLEK
ncbi:MULTISPECIES: hypothetical protein [Geomicrobium]|uniref:Uncharacterized protein n=1 Tax=Geomicrobium sediminis TaxID=1347788 RepID=A0ABS2PGL3_9BACL|nr:MULTISPECIES: hypothetical protein [Geomicrobium]MBM7634582.1 hypothetical protein [Geomicrobium sediminis]